MKKYTDITIIEGKLNNLLNGYIQELTCNVYGFQAFEDEAILYALLEYAKHPRKVSVSERLVYLHGKCLEYHGKPHVDVDVITDENEFFQILPIKKTTIIDDIKEDDLPF